MFKPLPVIISSKYSNYLSRRGGRVTPVSPQIVRGLTENHIKQISWFVAARQLLFTINTAALRLEFDTKKRDSIVCSAKNNDKIRSKYLTIKQLNNFFFIIN